MLNNTLGGLIDTPGTSLIRADEPDCRGSCQLRVVGAHNLGSGGGLSVADVITCRKYGMPIIGMRCAYSRSDYEVLQATHGKGATIGIDGAPFLIWQFH